ncbi:uncharacterized protein LOC134241314 [Saccostrea cucullata]|uniref:uncharacterized protein LOC134241314 n=1 Tax=Saccostrea cuccullata TaxID=36930 RepID=UPI002ED5168D
MKKDNMEKNLKAKFEKYDNMSFQFAEENPYDVMNIGEEKATHKHNFRQEDGQPGDLAHFNTSCLPLKKISYIFLVIALVFALVTLTALLYLEKNREEDQHHQPVFQEKQRKWTGSMGCTFLVSFLQSHISVNNSNRTIIVTSDTDFNITVSLSEKQSPNLISISNQIIGNIMIKKINVHPLMVPSYSSVEDKAILIKTSSISSVLSMNDLEFTSESNTVFPVDKLSTYYIISMTTPLDGLIDSGSHVTVASVMDNTCVSISLVIDRDAKVQHNGSSYGNGDKITIILDSFQTFQIGLRADLSGTTINASHPVAVFAGNRCNNLGDYGFCNMLVEMVPPDDKLDKIFIVPPNVHRYKTQVRIASPIETEIKYSIEREKTSVVVTRNQTIDFFIQENETAVIESIEPLLVNSFAYGSTQPLIFGDPYMITIPGINQYINEYILFVPENFNFSFATFMLKTDSLEHLKINETGIKENQTRYFSTVAVGTSFYSVWTLSIPSGVMKVRTTDGTPFGVIVYGQRKRDGHGYTGNAILSTCKDGWIHIENSCYLISLQRVTFKDALKSCNEETAHLSEHRNIRIERLIGLQLHAQGDVGVWIAATYVQEEGEYLYISDASRVNKNNWANGQPHGGKHYNCAVARKDDNWKWYAYPCRHTFHYVCKKPI